MGLRWWSIDTARAVVAGAVAEATYGLGPAGLLLEQLACKMLWRWLVGLGAELPSGISPTSVRLGSAC